MPIASIITQPVTNSIMASYRPVVFIVRASSTAGTAIPPVVYCDVYINGIFANTISKTQYTKLNSGDSDWTFDIQDICQKSIGKHISKNGGTIIDNPPELYKTVYCKFRSSGNSLQGFLVPEVTAPVQATSNTNATAGTGTQSNSFYILNVALQHASKQDLAAHLNVFKTGAWSATAWPLSHRIAKYKIGINNSDYFPFFYTGNVDGISLFYKLKGGTTFASLTTAGEVGGGTGGGGGGGGTGGGGPTCAPAAFSGSPSLPDAIANEAYSYSFALSGDAPFTLANIVKPSWLTINVSGSNVVFSGTPTTQGSNIQVSFNILNCSNSNILPFSDTFNVAAPTVEGVHFVATTFVGGDPTFDDEIANITGPAGATVHIIVASYINTNSNGRILVNTSDVYLSNTFDIVLNSVGHGQFSAKITGNSTDVGTIVKADFKITGVSIGAIGSQDIYTISKVF